MAAVLNISELPPGFGFHPTDEELVSHYLKRKIMGLKMEHDVIPELDIYKHEPWDLPGKSAVPSRDCKWHFFNLRDRKYPNGSRSNRATEKGYWKSTGKDRVVRSGNQGIGTKKTLVFHEGRPPLGKRTDWIMHEYYLNEKACRSAGAPKDLFVLCRITKRNGFTSEEEEVRSNGSALEQLPEISIPIINSRTVQEVNVELPSPYGGDEEDLSAWIDELTRGPDLPSVSGTSTVDNFLDMDWHSSYMPKVTEQDFSSYRSSFDWSELLEAAKFSEMLQFDLQDSAGVSPDGNGECLIFQDAASPTADTGIVIRHRVPREFTGTPGQHIKLQVHKMESGRAESTNHMVMLDNSDHHLESSDCNEAISTNRTPWNEQLKDDSHCSNGRSQKKDGNILDDVKRSLQGALQEAKMLVRSCSSVGPTSLLLGTCLVGAATVAYLHQEDS